MTVPSFKYTQCDEIIKRVQVKYPQLPKNQVAEQIKNIFWEYILTDIHDNTNKTEGVY